MPRRSCSRKRSAKVAEMKEDDQPRKRRKENIKQFQRAFDVIFRNIQFGIQLHGDMTLGDAKNKIKKHAAMFMQEMNASDIDNEHLRLRATVPIHQHPDDNTKLEKIFRFDLTDIPKLELRVEEAFGVTLKTPNSPVLHGLFVFPSDSFEDIYLRAFELSNKHRYQDHWFNIYCKRHGDSPLRIWHRVSEKLVAGDKLEMRYYHVNTFRDAAKMQIFVKTLEGMTVTIDALADGRDTIQNLKYMLFFRLKIPSRLQRLIFAGKQLEDRSHLWSYKIGNECTLHLIKRLTGS